MDKKVVIDIVVTLIEFYDDWIDGHVSR